MDKITDIVIEKIDSIAYGNVFSASDFPIGLLINFGASSLQFKKVYNPKYNPVNPKIK